MGGGGEKILLLVLDCVTLQRVGRGYVRFLYAAFGRGSGEYPEFSGQALTPQNSFKM